MAASMIKSLKPLFMYVYLISAYSDALHTIL